jgi:hypothetical protein
MAAPFVAWRFEWDKLQAALEERAKVRGKTPRTLAQIVNTALFSVALKAQKYTPKARPDQIRTSAFVTVKYVVDTRTGKLKPARKGNRFNYFESEAPDHQNVEGDHAEIELMFAIVLARANLSRKGRQYGMSLYNQRTYNRWYLDKAILTTRAVIRDIAERMVSARSSSSALLKAGWKNAMDITRPYIAANDIKGSRQGERFEYNKDLERLGTAVVAREGYSCWGMIENHVGAGGTRLDWNQRRALLFYGTLPLQWALSDEADEMLAWIRKHMDDDARAFNNP